MSTVPSPRRDCLLETVQIFPQSKIFLSNPQTTLYTSFFSPCSVWHTTQRLSQLFSILTGCMCDYYIAHTCYLPQVCLNTDYRSITCLKSNYSFNYYIKVPVILSRPFFGFVWKFIKFDFSSLYFLCCCSANKNIKHVNTKTFAIGRIIWENCKGADIFGRVCVYIYVCIYIYIYIYTCIHTYMHIHRHTHTHTHKFGQWSWNIMF